MKKKLLFAAAMLLAAVGVNAQTDVTSTYLTNADFSSTDGWSPVVSTQYKDYGNGLIGTYGVRTIEGQAVSTADDTHSVEEYCFGFECRWSSSYASFTQVTKTPLIPGAYTLTFDVENTNPKTSSASYENRFTVKVGETTYTDSSTEWMRGKSSWTTHTIAFTVEEEASATISLGYGTGSNNIGSTNTPTLHISHLKLTYQSLLDGLKAMWQEAHDAAQAAYENTDYSNVSGEENDALYAEIDKAEPTTADGYNAAIEALNDATAAFIAAKDSYDAYVEEYAYATLTLGLNIEQEDPANAAQALAATQALKVQEFNEIAEQYTEDVSATLSFDSSFGNTSGQHWNDTGTQYYDSWSGSATSKTLTITATALPAGDYMLKVAGRSAPTATLAMTDGTTTVDFFANGDKGLGIDTSGATNFSDDGTYANGNNGRGWQWRYLPITLSEAGDISVTVTANLAGNSWASVTKEIYLLGVPNAEISKAALKAAIDQASEVDTEINVGEGVFQKPESAASDFESILGAAQDVYEDPAATVEVVEATTEAVLAAIDNFANAPLNAPEAGNKYGIKIVKEGHPFLGNPIVAGKGDTSANNPTGYFFNVKDLYLVQGFTFTSAEDPENPNDYYISIELPEGTVYLTNGTKNSSAAGWAPSQIQGTTDSSAKMAFRIAASTTVEGAFNIINTANDYNVVAQNGGNIYTDENAQQNGEFALAEPTLVEVPVAVAAGKFATRIYPFVPEPISGVTFYTCATAIENELVLEEATELAANTPYILYAESDVDVTESGLSIAGAITYTDGWLTGVFANTEITSGYVLQTQNEKQAFYKVNAEKAITVPPCRAYLNKNDSSVKSFNLGDDTTGISALEALTNNAFEAIYSADGVKLNRIEKGVNILKMSDGTTRKVILK